MELTWLGGEVNLSSKIMQSLLSSRQPRLRFAVGNIVRERAAIVVERYVATLFSAPFRWGRYNSITKLNYSGKQMYGKCDFRAIDITTNTYLRDSDENVGRGTIEFLSPPLHIPP